MTEAGYAADYQPVVLSDVTAAGGQRPPMPRACPNLGRKGPRGLAGRLTIARCGYLVAAPGNGRWHLGPVGTLS